MTATISEDDPQRKQSPPPPAIHCRSTSTNIDDDTKPLDLSKKQNEQPLNLCSKRKRTTPVCLSKRTNNPLNSPTIAPNPASSMFLPFYAISPFLDTNQQEIFQQMQTYYLQLQQKLTKQ